MQWRAPDVARSPLPAAAALTAVFADGMRKFAAQTSQFVGAASRSGSTWLRELTAAKNPGEFARAHAHHARANSQMLIDHSMALGVIFVDILEAAAKAAPVRISDAGTKPPAATGAAAPAAFPTVAAKGRTSAPQSLSAARSRKG